MQISWLSTSSNDELSDLIESHVMAVLCHVLCIYSLVCASHHSLAGMTT